MNATPNEVQLLLDSIQGIRDDIHELRRTVEKYRSELNGRLRKLEAWRWYMAGGFALATTLIGLSTAFLS